MLKRKIKIRTNTLDFFDLVLSNFFNVYRFNLFGEFFLEFWKISKVTPKIENKGVYIYIYTVPTSPHLLFTKKIFSSKFIISFSKLVISHELGAIYFDISFFCFHCWKIHVILNFLFLLCQ